MEDTLYDLVIGNIDGSKLPDMSHFAASVVTRSQAKKDERTYKKLKVPDQIINSDRNAIDKLIDLIERTFQREGSPYLACSDRNAFFTSEKPKKYHAWSCQNVCDALTFCWTTFLFDLAPSSIDK